jgi:hypothetical protein
MNQKGTQKNLFYKYRGIDKYTKGMILNNEFCFLSPINYNDSFDSAFWVHIEGTEDEWEWFMGVEDLVIHFIPVKGRGKTVSIS